MKGADSMKCWILCDELWPYYELEREDQTERYISRYEGLYDVPDKLYEDYIKAQAAFMELRRQIRDIHTGSDPIQ
jgi:hypothetical protein